MIVAMNYLQPDKKTGVLNYRRRFPRGLVRHIPGGSPTGKGRVELKISLRSKDMKDPQARARYAAAEDQYEAIVSKARRVATLAYDSLDEALVRYLVDTYVHDHLQADEAMRWRRGQRAATYETRGHPEAVYEACRELLEAYDGDGLVEYWKDWACAYADALGYLLDPADPEFSSLCQGLGEASCTVWLGLDARIEGTFAATPAKPGAPVSTLQLASPACASGSETFQAIADTIMESSLEPVGHSTHEAWSTALRFFKEVHGEPMVGDINKRMVTEWLELLKQRPARLSKEDRFRSLPDVIVRYAGRENIDRIAPKTLRQHLASLATIWNKAQERGQIDDVLPNPFKARKSLAGGPSVQGAEFSMAEVQAILALPVFTKGERPARGSLGEALRILAASGVAPHAHLLLFLVSSGDHAIAWLQSDLAQFFEDFSGELPSALERERNEAGSVKAGSKRRNMRAASLYDFA